MRRNRGGFTLLELIVVIAIISVAFSIIWPRLPRMASVERSETLRKLAGSAQVMFEHAAFKKKV